MLKIRPDDSNVPGTRQDTRTYTVVLPTSAVAESGDTLLACGRKFLIVAAPPVFWATKSCEVTEL